VLLLVIAVSVVVDKLWLTLLIYILMLFLCKLLIL